MKRWKISHEFIFSFCSDPTSISVSVSNLRERERERKSFCLSVHMRYRGGGGRGWKDEGLESRTPAQDLSLSSRKSHWPLESLSICSVTALALLRGILYTFVCYTEAAQKKPNIILPFNHWTWVDRGQLDGSWALRQGGFLVRALNQIPESLKRFLELSGTGNLLF